MKNIDLIFIFQNLRHRLTEENDFRYPENINIDLFVWLFVYLCFSSVLLSPFKTKLPKRKKAGSGSVLLILGRALIGNGIQHHQWFIRNHVTDFYGVFSFSASSAMANFVRSTSHISTDSDREGKRRSTSGLDRTISEVQQAQ